MVFPHESSVERVYFSPNGIQLITFTSDGEVHFWDITTGYPKKTGVSISENTKQLSNPDLFQPSFSCDSIVCYISLFCANALTILDSRSQDIDVNLSSSGLQIATIDNDGIAHLWAIDKKINLYTLYRPLLIFIIIGGFLAFAFGFWVLQSVKRIQVSSASLVHLEGKIKVAMMFYPKSFREDFGEEMPSVLAKEFIEAYKNGGSIEFFNVFTISAVSLILNALSVDRNGCRRRDGNR